MRVRYVLCQKHSSTSSKMMGIKDLHMEFVFSVQKLATGQATAFTPTAVQIGQARQIMLTV